MTQPQRPTFWEGQILAGADLDAIVTAAADRDARHDRYLHDWGIAEGLDLTKVSRTDDNGDPYVEVTLQPGVAVDGTGREIVVAAPVRLSEPRFFEANGASPDPQGFYPVLLRGVDQLAPVAGQVVGACAGSAQSNRTVEGFEIRFGALGSAGALDDQEPPPVDAGGGDPVWDVLLGFVQWREIAGGGRFTDAVPAADGEQRRYAGVRADTVAARAGRLQLRTRPRAQAGEPAVVLEATPPALRFGLLKADGGLDERFKVDAAGNVKVQGTVAAQIQPGEVVVQSGVATDGVVLPLPAGVTAEAVRDGQVTVHTQLTPHIPVPKPSAAGVYRPLECGLDADRRVQCRVLWFDLSSPGAGQEQAAAVDYLMIVTGGGVP